MSRLSIHALQRDFPGTLRFVFRHFPLEQIHPHARAAAAAAEGAARQSNFWRMHEYLFQHQNGLEDADLQMYATRLGLDPVRFGHDRASREVACRIDRDHSSGEASGVEGAPTFYVNGFRHDGGYNLDSLRSAIVAHLTGVAHRP